MRDIVITSSVLIMAVLLIRFLARGKISPILQYALWLPVALRLMIPIPLWNSSISILNYLPENLMWENSNLGNDTAGISTGNVAADVSDSGAGIQTDGVTGGSMPTGSNAAAGGTALTDSTPPDGTTADAAAVYVPEHTGNTGRIAVDSGTILTVIWLAGIVCVGGYMLFYQIKWKKYLRENARTLSGREKYRNKLSVYTVKGLPSPCLCGRRIYLTKEMASDERRLEHILMHEYCHYRHFDSVWVIVRCVLTAVYWFNPLVWAAAYLSKQDSELACDEAALRLLGEEERIAYGKTLLALIAEESYGRNRIGIASTMSGGEKGIRERIFRIAKKRTYFAILTGVVIAVAAVLVAVTFSGKRENEVLDNIEEMQDSMERLEAAEAEEEALKALQEELEAQNALIEELAKEKEEVMKELEKQKVAKNEAFYTEVLYAGSEAVLEKLASYDERIALVGSTTGITDAKNPSDYIQAYYQKGEEAVEEDVYLLERRKGADDSDIKIYGMYTKEFGFRGIKILVGSDANDFDEPWTLSYQHGTEENLALYALAEDGMPRTFAFKEIAVNTSSLERWNFYLCDRYDTGTIVMSTLDTEEIMKQIQKRISFEIIPDECKIDVYDNGKKVGSIEVAASASSMEKIKEVVCDGSGINFRFGKNEEEIRMWARIGLKKDESDDIWYRRLSLLSFSITCGSFGERNLQLGEVSVDEQYVSGDDIEHSGKSIDEWIEKSEEVADVFQSTDILAEAFQSPEGQTGTTIQYQNPCPAATRISDTFGERTHPTTLKVLKHDGIDLAAENGAAVLAAADGVVIQTGFDYTSGHYVVLYHEVSGEYTYYCHCSKILVSEGEKVNVGDKIATVGSTGLSTGPHLHFALSRDGEYIEPVFVGREAYEYE